MSKNLDYNSDPVKHYVRFNGWVHSFRAIKNYVDRELKLRRRNSRCKYLTFCAVQAVDVFMFEYLNYIYREPGTKRLSNVYFFENDEEAFSAITKMIGSEQQGFFGDFKKIVLQPIVEDAEDPMYEPVNEEEREMLRLRNLKANLLATFPFDVINLDFYGNFFPKYEERFSESCQSFKQILEFQRISNSYECKRFLMYLTVYTPVTIEHINRDAFNTLEGAIYTNFQHEKFCQAFNRRFSHQDPKSIEFHLSFIIGFAKQVLFKESYNVGWEPTLKEIFCYDREKPSTGEEYKMSTFIVEFTRNDSLLQNDFMGEVPASVVKDYLLQLESLLLEMPIDVPAANEVPNEVKDHLRAVIEFRNEFLQDIGIYDEERFGVN